MITTFGEVRLGGQFTMLQMERKFKCVKVDKTTIANCSICNAVLIEPTDAVGVMIFVEDDVPVKMELLQSGRRWATSEGMRIIDPEGWRELCIDFDLSLVSKKTYIRLRAMSTLAT